VIRHALKMLRERKHHGLSEDLREGDRGSLSIGTTHTQARYVCHGSSEVPFQLPNVQFHLHQGTSEQMQKWLSSTGSTFHGDRLA